MTKWLITAVSFLYTAVVLAQAPNINFDRVTIENGISQNTIVSIAQDHKGFLWIGTQDGLNRYDGYEFRIYSRVAGDLTTLSHNRTSSLVYGNTDSLIVGTIGGLNIFNTRKEVFTHIPQLPKRLTSSLVNSIELDKKSNLWVGTNYGLNFITTDGEVYKYMETANDSTSLSHNNITYLLSENDGTLWVGTSNGLNKTQFKKTSPLNFNHFFSESSGLSNNAITCIYKDNHGTIWVGTQSGLNRYNKETASFEAFYPSQNGPEGNFITCMQEDSKGNFWIGTKGGLALATRMSGSDPHFYFYNNDPENPKSISNDWVTAIFEDETNVLWVGTFFGGLNKYDLNSKKFNLYRHRPKNTNTISNNIIRGMTEDHNGNLWVATFNGLNKIDSSGNVSRFYKSQGGLGENYIKSLLTDQYGDIWIGTGGNGLNKYETKSNRFVQITPDDHAYKGTDIWVIFEDSDGEIWFGTEESGLNRYNPATNTFKNYQKSSGLVSSNKVYALNEDKEGKIWIGTWHGLDLYDKKNEKWTHYYHDPSDPQSLPENYIKSIIIDHNDTPWISTAGAGISKMVNEEEGIFKTYNKSDGLSNNFTYGILEDRNGNLWVSTNYGLSKFDPKHETFVNFDEHEGLQGNEFNTGSFYKGNNGYLYFGGLSGITYFDPDSITRNPYSPEIIISDIKIYNQPLKPGDSTNLDKPLQEVIAYTDKLSMSYKNKVVSFEFAALHFVNPKKNRYAYKLEGFDTTWTYTSADKRFATYTNLPHGEYTFKVKAANNDGLWNETPTQLTISITPPFWETLWFRVLAVITIIGIAVSIHRYRVYSINEQKKALAKEVKERTKEIKEQNELLNEQNNEILTTNEELAQKQDEIIAQNEALEARGQELEKSYENIRVISDIGHEISSLLDFTTIIEKVYEHINNLMDASEFSIGIYNEEEETLAFAPYIYNSQKYDGYTVSVNDSRLTCWSVLNKKTVWIGNFEKEYKDYIPELEYNERDIILKSIICIPLLVESRRIGMVCIQSPKENAYSQYHFDMLNALATYIAVGLDNSNAYHDLESKVQARTQDLNKAYSKLIDANRQFDEFTYRSAHDLRGPLARLLGLCYLGKLEVGNEPAKGLEYLNLLERAAFEMDHLLGRLLRTHENKKRVVSKTDIDIKGTVDEALENIKKTESLEPFKFKIDVNANLKLQTDEFLFRVLLENIIINAIHFYDREKPSHEVQVNAYTDNGYVKINIKDNGIGIPRDQQQRIFDMFFIGSEVSKGSGLGLYESKMIVEKLGGHLRLLHSDEQFTEFEISLN